MTIIIELWTSRQLIMKGEKMRIGEKNGNKTIGNKIFKKMTVLIGLTVILLIISSLLITRQQMVRKNQESAKKDLKIVTEKFDMFVKSIHEDATRMLASDECQTLLSNSAELLADQGRKRYEKYRQLNETLQSLYSQENIYRAIILYDPQGAAYPEVDGQGDSERIIERQEEVIGFLEREETDCWITLHKSPWSSRSSGSVEDCISYLHKVYDQHSGVLIGVMELEINMPAFEELYKTLAEDGNHIFITDKLGYIQSADQRDYLFDRLTSEDWYKQLISQEDGHFRFTQTSHALYVMTYYEPLQYNVSMSISLEEYYRNMLYYSIVVLGIGGCLLLMSIAVARKEITIITDPLTEITSTIQDIGKGSWGKRLIGEYDGELRYLTEEFNKMLDHLQALMDHNIKIEKNKRKSERALIQLQMTPHFFYNILENICGMIVIDDKKQAIHTIGLLSNFYRNVLSKGQECISIEKELEIAYNYLEIMKICHPGRFFYRIDCPEELKGYQIVKLTLQPLLENAIHHGIVPKDEEGNIKITVSSHVDMITIVIADNGIGIEAEKLKKLMSGEGAGTRMDSFGVRNTNERLKLYFGGQYGLKIESNCGQGTTVTVQIPKQFDLA